jgi:hypothetical protein
MWDFPISKNNTWSPELTVKFVPIPCVEEVCSKCCCTRIFVPLELSFATTIHRCQGLSVGPVQPGQPPNPAEKIIVDIGTSRFEAIVPGLFYVALSRATTMGGGDRRKSAIFFNGDNVTQERLVRMTYKKDSTQKLIRIERRDAWVDLLERHTHKSNLTSEYRNGLFLWASTASFSRKWTMERISKDGFSSDVP